MTREQLERYRQLLADETIAEMELADAAGHQPTKDAALRRVVRAYAATQAYERELGWTEDQCLEALEQLGAE